MLDLANHTSSTREELIRHFSEVEDPKHKVPEGEFWDLPASRSGDITDQTLASASKHRERLALLLHLAAFFLRSQENSEPTSLLRGLRQYVSTPDLRQTGWNKDSGRFFAENRREFQEGGSHVYAATCYFGRLLAWGESVFGQAGGVALSSNDSSYVSIHNTMGSISFDEIKRSGEDGKMPPAPTPIPSDFAATVMECR